MQTGLASANRSPFLRNAARAVALAVTLLGCSETTAPTPAGLGGGGSINATGGDTGTGGALGNSGGTGDRSGSAGAAGSLAGAAGASTDGGSPGSGGTVSGLAGSAGIGNAGIAGIGNAGIGNAGFGNAGASGQSAGAAVTKDGETLVTSAGLTIVSYGGYLNGEAFQQEGIATYKKRQYAAFWNTARHVVLARRELPTGKWSTIEFTDYKNSASDAHNTISIGIAPGDATLHLSFDHHGDDLHYRSSQLGFLDATDDSAWSTASFSAVTSALVGSTPVALVTYPRFVTEPGGKQLLFSARLGESGSGDEYL